MADSLDLESNMAAGGAAGPVDPAARPEAFLGLDEGAAEGKESSENVNEAMYLFIIAGVGLFLNLGVVTCIFACRSLRKMTSAFIVHGCILDIIKCGYCVPFAQSLLKDVAPSFCTVLGGSYVVVITASGFNIVAMICCEAYTFSEHNVGTSEPRGTLCCVVFGIMMVYVGSVIIHLGPTIIGKCEGRGGEGKQVKQEREKERRRKGREV